MRDVKILLEAGVNVSKSLELFGDMKTYDETLAEFLKEVDSKLEKLKEYKEVADMANYAIYVHSLKTDAKYFGFGPLADLAYQQELESKANNIYYIYDHYDELIAEANKMIELSAKYLGAELPEKEEVHKNKDKKILVVDDSNIICNFITKISAEYEVLTAHDGEEALRYLESVESSKIIGMLLDLNMPNIDGFSVLDYFMAKHLFEKVPVAIITGEDSKENIEKVREYPIVSLLRKPFNEKDVKEIVEKFEEHLKSE